MKRAEGKRALSPAIPDADEPKGASRSHAIGAFDLSFAEVAKRLGGDIGNGLSDAEAARRLAAYGPNRLEEEHSIAFWEILGRQFKSFLITILIAAGVISMALGETADSLTIFAIVILNAALGTIQEYRAERALAALLESTTPTARVMREKTVRTIPSAEVVRGDLVIIQAGDLVPADLRLVESHSLSIDESPLTGESEPVKKDSQGVLPQETALADRRNCAYSGTRVGYGRGTGIAFATATETELGRIAGMVRAQRRMQTPLQQKLGELGTWLGAAALILCAIIFATGLLYGKPLFEMFFVAVSLAVAAVPEGLPAVVTIALALGLQRMLKRHALIRRLAAVETLGEATVICTDKTGTLTRGVMEVERLSAVGTTYSLAEQQPLIKAPFSPTVPEEPLHILLLAMSLCNDAMLQKQASGEFAFSGSPTEVALVHAAQAAGFPVRSEIEKHFPRVAEVPFDSGRKRMATAHRTPTGTLLVLVKGAPDVVLPLCSRFAAPGGSEEMNEEARAGFLAEAEELAAQAYRLLAIAYRQDDNGARSTGTSDLEQDLTFLGIAGLLDAPRAETADAVAQCRRAGIRTVMVTGDHAKTALAIAKSIGMAEDETRVVTGPEVDALSTRGLQDALNSPVLFSRVSPRHKLRIVKALQDQKEIVAMTGDGSNDAPALKRADIGVAMGIRGTDVAKEAADMVLTDDNFQSIVAAIHEGRVIYANIRKVVMYLLSCNLGEILAVFVAMVAGLPLLLQPIQILWLNLVTDGLPALALSVEKEEPGTMHRKPRNPRESVLTGGALVLLLTQGVTIAGVTLAAFIMTLQKFPHDVALAQTAAFITLTLGELVRAYAFRTEGVSVFKQGLFSNPSMIWATLVSSALLFAVVYVPFFQEWFKTVPPQTWQWTYIAPLVFLPFALGEIRKGRAEKRNRT